MIVGMDLENILKKFAPVAEDEKDNEAGGNAVGGDGGAGGAGGAGGVGGARDSDDDNVGNDRGGAGGDDGGRARGKRPQAPWRGNRRKRSKRSKKEQVSAMARNIKFDGEYLADWTGTFETGGKIFLLCLKFEVPNPGVGIYNANKSPGGVSL